MDRPSNPNEPPRQPAWIATYPPSGQGSRARQLADQVRRAIGGQALEPGDRLPASRILAQALGLSRGTVVSALEQLCAEGLLTTRIGAGTFVTAAAAPEPRSAQANSGRWVAPQRLPSPAAVDSAAPGLIDFRPCRPSVDSFPLAEWRRCVSWAARVRPNADYGDPRGEWRLRDAISHYLRRARGLQVGAEQIMITNGAVHAMHLLAQVYLAVPEGAEPAAAIMEDPGYPLARQILQGTGARVLDCPVDHDGLQTDMLPDQPVGVRMLYTTPAHQFPTGSRLSLPRRRTLVDWAMQHQVLIIEDDYDGEFRYDVQPLAPLAAIGKGYVAYCGSFSKTLFPDLRMGFVAAHPAQIDALARYRVRTDYTSNTVVQRALARFLDDGLYERHILRMRREYAGKRQALAAALATLDQPAQISGVNSGLNALVRFPDADPSAVVQLAQGARRRGALMPLLSQYYATPDSDHGLVLGFAALTEDQIQRGIAALRAHDTHSA